jgi:hypothetical protein
MFKASILHSLSKNQTAELRGIWEAQKAKLKPTEYLFIKVRLGRPEAKLTANQAYRLMMTLAELDVDPVPEWLIALFDSQEAK